jgi:hypothetical protein
MDTEAFKIITPVATFILGSILTLAAKAVEQRRETVRTAAREAMRLTKEWYVQIHALLLADPSSQLSSTISTGVYDYVHNRLILPDFLFHLSILSRHRKAARLTEALEGFLAQVSSHKPRFGAQATQHPDLLECKTIDTIGQGPHEVLSLLDGHVQRVAREAAALL